MGVSGDSEIVVTAARGRDLYMVWSSAWDTPTTVGPEAQVLAERPDLTDHFPSAKRNGSSCHGPRAGHWRDSGMVFRHRDGIHEGFVTVDSNRVIVLAEWLELASEIDVRQAEQELEEARKQGTESEVRKQEGRLQVAVGPHH